MHTQEWSEIKAALHLEDGSVFHGISFGANVSTSGEVVFQTGMVGYVESLTDPSYHQQLVVLTYPMIGNYGVPSMADKDANGLPKHFEAERIWTGGLIIDHLCEDGQHSHWQAVISLRAWLTKEGIPGICGIDTRQLTKKIRQFGTMKGKVSFGMGNTVIGKQ